MDSNELDLTGKKIGEYELLGRIGVGGMGAVFEGHQPLIGKRVAVKVLLPHLSEDPEAVGRFLSEARAVNAIRHRGIVDIFSFGQLPQGSHYFVMELLKGKPLDLVIAERAPLEPLEVLPWMAEVCDALGAAHEAGVIHRDIKPSNIFLVEGRGRSYVKVLDFGVAKLGGALRGNGPLTKMSMVVGTPNFMAPEQVRGEQVVPATDLYAVGCVLFELLTNQRAFPGDNPLDTMMAQLEKPTPRLRSVIPNAPVELDELLASLMDKDAARRPVNADATRDLLEALHRRLLGERDAPRAQPGVAAKPKPVLVAAPPAVALAQENPFASVEATLVRPENQVTPHDPATQRNQPAVRGPRQVKLDETTVPRFVLGDEFPAATQQHAANVPDTDPPQPAMSRRRDVTTEPEGSGAVGRSTVPELAVERPEEAPAQAPAAKARPFPKISEGKAPTRSEPRPGRKVPLGDVEATKASSPRRRDRGPEENLAEAGARTMLEGDEGPALRPTAKMPDPEDLRSTQPDRLGRVRVPTDSVQVKGKPLRNTPAVSLGEVPLDAIRPSRWPWVILAAGLLFAAAAMAWLWSH